MRSPRRSHPETSVPASFTTEALVVFLVALLIRLLHLWQMQRSPFAGTLLGDALAYDTWARQIAGGDWLGHDVFYQTPLYPYFLGTLYSFNHSFALVRLCQAGIGAGSCVLLAFATRRLFGNRAGLVAGLILAMYAPAVFFDGLIQKSVLDVFLICLSLMLLTDLGAEPTKPVRWFAVGVTLGVLALTRENALLFIGVVPVWLWIHHRRFGPARLTFAALLFAGAATVLVPVGLRNQLVGGEFHLTTAQFGPNFYIGNGPDADGTYIGLRPQRGRGMVEYERIDATELADQATGLRLSPAQVSRYWTVRTLNGILAHPMRWIALEGRKIRWMWNATEMMDTESQDAYEEWSTVLSVLGRFAHFGVLAPLAVVGIWLTWKDRRQLWLVYALLGAYVVSVLAFYVLARYRYPMVPFLVIFAAAAIVNVKEISAMRPIRMGAGAALLVAATVFCNWPTAFLRDGMRAQTYVNLGERLLSDGHPEAAAAAYERAVASTPTDPDPRMTLGTLLIKQGALDRAIEQLDVAVHLRPDSAEAEFNLALALNNARRYQEAVDHYRSVLQRNPHPAETAANLSVSEVNLGADFEQKGDPDRAIDLFRDAVKVAPASVHAHYRLGRALLGKGAIEEAAQHFAAAIRLDPTDATAHYALGVTLERLGRLKDAADEFREALRINPENGAARRNLELLNSRQPHVPS